MNSAEPEFGSLAQTARKTQLTTARTILIAVGLLTVFANAFFFTLIEDQVDQSFKDQREQLRRQGQVVDGGEYERLKDNAVRVAKMIQGSAVALGVVFLVLGAIVFKFPVPATVAGLVLYIGSAAVFGFIDPTTLASGLIIKLLIVVGLFKSVNAARAYEAEASQAAGPSPITLNE